jgi:hypothetical protein
MPSKLLQKQYQLRTVAPLALLIIITSGVTCGRAPLQGEALVQHAGSPSNSASKSGIPYRPEAERAG